MICHLCHAPGARLIWNVPLCEGCRDLLVNVISSEASQAVLNRIRLAYAPAAPVPPPADPPGAGAVAAMEQAPPRPSGPRAVVDILVARLLAEDPQGRETAPVIAGLRARMAVGLARYGVALQPHNGRSARVDTWQELLDAVVYAGQDTIEEQDTEAIGLAADILVIAIRWYRMCARKGWAIGGRPS